MTPQTIIATKISEAEKLAFLELCESEGLKPAVALHTLVSE